jgi:superoxide dismutase, Cu-Zn family
LVNNTFVSNNHSKEDYMRIKWIIAAVFVAMLMLPGCRGQLDNEKELTAASGSAEEIESMPVRAGAAQEARAVTVTEQMTKEGAKLPTKPVMVDLINSQGMKIGDAMLTQGVSGVLIKVEAKLPQGRHAIHIHEKSACDTPSFESAGGHFNPTGKKHGFLNPQGLHAGDLPNVIVKEDGKLSAELFAPFVTLEQEQPNSLLKDGGTALVIHEGTDDYLTDPAGGAGKRIACGPIR